MPISTYIKDRVRSFLQFLHLDITPNLRYDRLTLRIMQKVIQPTSNCIDVGCHKGEILEQIIKLAPKGKHSAFEPIPVYAENLIKEFGDKVTIFPYALSNQAGVSSFHFVRNAPAFSGIKQRSYLIANPDIEKIDVELRRLDDLLQADLPIHFMKIDVEGGEFDVLKGAVRTLKTYKPIVIFESGLGASERYGTKPETLFQFLREEVGLNVSLLKAFLNNEPSLSQSAFVRCFKESLEFYYIAHP
ncbi:MAG: FkbM family methyltransferase [Flavobacteriales bacterium]|nr:FkbM family methyltransferase [Flavobacteriales bacterium]MCZ2444127.1 FkbM family methyltransferase [Flavobacteriales bacterium]